MVDMNVIVLEGFGLFLALVLQALGVILVITLSVAGCAKDEKIENLQAENKQLEISNTRLSNENWHYRLKYGELDPGKEVGSDVRNKMCQMR